MNAPAISHSGKCRTGLPVRNLALYLLGVVCLIGSGCRPNKRYDLIEAELRTRDRELAETRAALDQARVINRAYDQSRSEPSGVVTSQPSQSGVVPGYSIREITLARGTGGVDEDDTPGDESLMVVVVPTDEDRSAVKVPARLTVAAWEVNSQGLKSPIGLWEISTERLRSTWRSGLLASGYFVPLQWQTFPTTGRVRVAIRLTTLDNRTFEADRDISVRPVPQAIPHGGPAIPPEVPGVYPTTPVVPPTKREPLLPGQPPSGVPQAVPPGFEELPPPAGMTPDRPARLLPPK